MSLPPVPPEPHKDPLVFPDNWLRGLVIAVLLVLGFLVALVVVVKLLSPYG